jgi:hypothetical protein
MLVAPGLLARAGVASGDAALGEEAVADPRTALVAEAVGVAPVLADGAVARGADAAWAVCEGVGFDAVAGLLDAGDVGSDAVADLRAAAAPADDADACSEAGAEGEWDAVDDADADVEGAADRVGGTGASPDPRSPASSMGDAQVPEYALSAGADAHEPDDDVVAPELPATAESDAFAARAVESEDEEPEVFAAVAGLDACPEAAAGMVGIPNPAGDFGASAPVDALADAL